MRKRRYLPGERKDRMMKVLEYIASNPGCRRLNIDAYMNSFYKSSLKPQTVSDYLEVLLMVGVIREKDGQFFITNEGKKDLDEHTRKISKD